MPLMLVVLGAIDDAAKTRLITSIPESICADRKGFSSVKSTV